MVAISEKRSPSAISFCPDVFSQSPISCTTRLGTYRIKAKTISGNFENFFKIIGNFKRSPHHGFFVQKSTKNLICISDSRGCATPEDSDADFRSGEQFFFFIFWIKWAKPNDKLTKWKYVKSGQVERRDIAVKVKNKAWKPGVARPSKSKARWMNTTNKMQVCTFFYCCW